MSKIDEIIKMNLHEKLEEKTYKVDYCEQCIYYETTEVGGVYLHCCMQDKENIKTDKDSFHLYMNCSIDNTLTREVMCIKRYGIIHHSPDKDSCKEYGSINIVDFSGTTFESDGYNPDVDWVNVAIFFYTTDEEKDKMMKFAEDMYDKLNIDSEYIVKRCYG